MHDYRVLVIGGYGFFGSRLVARLARQDRLHVIVAGRSGVTAQALVDQLQPDARAALSHVALDAMATDFAARLVEVDADLVIHTSGPFQGQDYRVADACANARVDYIDLADGREFVCGIEALQATAVANGVMLTSGASSVPALSTAVVDRLATAMSSISSIDIGISPGNRTERGFATVAAVLSYCGKPMATGGQRPTFGWLGSYRHRYPAPVGVRLLSPCDVPDLCLLPARYTGSPMVRFGAGLELRFLHRGMNLLAWLARLGVVHNWAAHAVWLKRVADWFQHWGTDAGAMHVSVIGRDELGVLRERAWVLVAGSGSGPYVPTLAAAALVRKLASGTLKYIGARPCTGLLSLEDFMNETQGLDIQMMELQS